MNTRSVVLVLALIAIYVEAHTLMTKVRINGQELTNCLRPAYPDNLYGTTNMGSQWPISSSNFLSEGVNSGNYTCGFLPYASQAAAGKCSVAAGSTIGVYHYHGAGYGTEDPELDKYIARSHKGPFMAFLAKSDTGSGNVWFKIHQEGKISEATDQYDYQTVKWASPDTMLANGGYFNFKIPSDIAPGNYLLRVEIIAMHDTSYHGAQPYVRCVELQVTGTGTANPAGVAIPGDWSYDHPGFTYNIYNQFTQAYPFPGPAVYTEGSASGSATSAAAATSASASATSASASGTSSSASGNSGYSASGYSTSSSGAGASTSGSDNTPRVTAKITVRVKQDPAKLDLNYFIYEITQVVGIPQGSVTDVVVDLDQSTSTETVITFSIWNAPKGDGSRVNPVEIALRLKNMAANQDPAFDGTSYLSGMEVVDVQENPDNAAQSGAVSVAVSAATLVAAAALVF